MLFKTNIFGLVGAEKNPNYKQTDVIIWDALKNENLCKISLKEKVLNLKLRGDKIIVVCSYMIHVFNLMTFQNIDNIETGFNPDGLIGVSYEEEKGIIAYPDKGPDRKGYVRVKCYQSGKNFYIPAHENEIGYIELTFDGLLLATASRDGKTIRVFDASNGDLLQEFNRGMEKADIKCITIAYNNKYLASSSERGTIHIWSLDKSRRKIKQSGKIIMTDEDNSRIIKNTKNAFGTFIPKFIRPDYFNRESSFAQVRLEEPYSIFTFGIENYLIIICSSGKYYKAKIDLVKGGDCQVLQEEQLI